MLARARACIARADAARADSHRQLHGKCMFLAAHSKCVGVNMSRYMAAMATRFFPTMALAAIGPGPDWQRPPKTRNGSLGTFRSYFTFFSSTRHSIAKTMGSVRLARPRLPRRRLNEAASVGVWRCGSRGMMGGLEVVVLGAGDGGGAGGGAATVNISPTVPPIPVQFKKSKNTIASASATAPVLAASGLSHT